MSKPSTGRPRGRPPGKGLPPKKKPIIPTPWKGTEPGERKRIVTEVMRQLNREGVTPLEIFGKMMRGDRTISTEQFEAAKAAAPYMHPKLSAITMDATVRRDITDFTDEELYAIAGSGEAESED